MHHQIIVLIIENNYSWPWRAEEGLVYHQQLELLACWGLHHKEGWKEALPGPKDLLWLCCTHLLCSLQNGPRAPRPYYAPRKAQALHQTSARGTTGPASHSVARTHSVHWSAWKRLPRFHADVRRKTVAHWKQTQCTLSCGPGVRVWGADELEKGNVRCTPMLYVVMSVSLSFLYL